MAVAEINDSLTYHNSNESEKSKIDLEGLYLTSYGVVLPIIIVVGLTGNILTLVVLSRRAAFSAISYIYLRCLAASDLCSLLCWLPTMVSDGWRVDMSSHSATTYYASWDLFLSNSFLTTSAFLIVALTVERHLSVRKLKQVQHGQSGAMRMKTYAVLIAIFIAAMFINLPGFFQHDVVEKEVIVDASKNVTEVIFTKVMNKKIYDGQDMELVFLIYTWSLVAITKFIPMLLVLILNSFTFHSFHLLARERQKTMLKNKFQEQQRLMIMLVCVAVLFIVCLTPMALLYILYSEENLTYFGFHVFRVTANLLEISNSAINFYAYCLASRHFRHHLGLVCACLPCVSDKERKDISGSMMTTVNGTRMGSHVKNDNAQEAVTLKEDEVENMEQEVGENLIEQPM